MRKEVILKADKALTDLIQNLSSFDDQQMNKVPFAGSWTPAQIAEHLFKSYDLTQVLVGNVSETSRPIDQHVKEVSDLFLDFEVKMKSPEFILPSEEPIDVKNLMTSLKEKKSQIVELAETLDLTKTCLDFEIPEYGNFTRLEWLYFMIFHTQRHVHQLSLISQHATSEVVN